MSPQRILVDELLLLDDDDDDYILTKALLHGAFGDAVKLDWYQKGWRGYRNDLFRVSMRSLWWTTGSASKTAWT